MYPPRRFDAIYSCRNERRLLRQWFISIAKPKHMVDRVDPTTRSFNMSRVRSKNTRPEMLVRKAVHRLGFRFRLHQRELPGTPDLVFPKHRKILFVHGCFWHRHPGCAHSTMPQTRPQFWRTKFEANQRRDRIAQSALRALGWTVDVIWECEVKNPESLRIRLRRFLIETDRPKKASSTVLSARGR
jgi:DNA mismatch endonuclease (patch repair protein)